MAQAISIMGESGSGKSTSLRNLDPKSTFIISVLGKDLPFEGSKNLYNAKNKNWHVTTSHKSIWAVIKNVNTNAPHIKTLVIDDFQYMMADQYVTRAFEVGFNKFTEMAKSVYDTIRMVDSMREDLNVYFIFHTIESEGTYRIKTLGKMLDNAITLEGMFNINLYTKNIDGDHFFITRSDGTHTGKTPIGMFEADMIENDINLVNKAIATYYDNSGNQKS